MALVGLGRLHRAKFRGRPRRHVRYVQSQLSYSWSPDLGFQGRRSQPGWACPQRAVPCPPDQSHQARRRGSGVRSGSVRLGWRRVGGSEPRAAQQGHEPDKARLEREREAPVGCRRGRRSSMNRDPGARALQVMPGVVTCPPKTSPDFVRKVWHNLRSKSGGGYESEAVHHGEDYRDAA